MRRAGFVVSLLAVCERIDFDPQVDASPRRSRALDLSLYTVITLRRVILLSLVGAGCRFGFETPSATDSGANVDASEDACASYVTWGSLSSRYRQGSALDWGIAEADCESDGGHLAVVNDMPERDELRARLSSDFWIGLSDRITEGQYLEVTGASATYLAWSGTPPSNVGEDCVEVLLNSNYEDTACTKLVALTYACECDGVSAEPGAF